MITHWIRTAAMAAIAFGGYAAWRRRRGSPTAGEPLARWEGEGGAVPTIPRRPPAGPDLLDPAAPGMGSVPGTDLR